MRKQKYRIILSVVMLCIMAVSICSCSSTTSTNSDVLKVGVRDDIMNFGYLNPMTDQYYGLEIDLAYKLAEDLGYAEVEFITVEPDTRKEMLLEGEVDCLIAAYSIADSRLENFDFSEPYYTDYGRIMIEKSTLFTGMKDLLHKRIGVLDGANAAPKFVIKMNEMGLLPDLEDETIVNNITLVRMDDYSDLYAALEDGSVDAVCMDGCIARAYMDEEECMFLEETLSEERYGVATQKGSALSEPVAKSIQKMLDDGTIEKLIDKWD